ncbi:hypothetical protein VW29_01900 [Devosia limi DSM 17137]|uniref:YdhG-like domain-containing protein n=1 Tax=Devosia limi DSM 17137 TaxID=1121477 RepID=A0A0F5LVJ7_9HYPH|nr:DUF1801 domain-containing protein [Devosia limi]KKB86358.1 hypothetical protein VW29_01900 [Devosia limi DSM 17137]SHE92470.1 hypothetical protein SAMN02745223_01444 [Devosia limi DSM 17137]
MSVPDLPAEIAAALARHPPAVQARLLAVRALIFAVAAETEGVGALSETLKWGEPAYLTAASGSGTTIRLGVSKMAPGAAAVFVNCRTSLVDFYREQFGDVFEFEGNRALIVRADGPLPAVPLGICLRAALLYHRRQHSRG